MDVFTALQTAVSGLKAQSHSLENISGNIANSQTTGFKRVDTSFVDLVAEQAPSRQVSGSVLSYSRPTNSIQGGINATEIPTNVALNGPGFFAVQTKIGDANGQSAFANNDLYTRRGDFAPDNDGYLRNGGGAYLTGTSIDPVTGLAQAEGPIQLPKSTIPARATTSITYQGNLPKTPAPKSGKEILTTTALGTGNTNPIALADGAVGTITAANATALLQGSIEGPALTVYSESGAPVTLKTVWAKVQDGNGTAKDTWNLYYANDTSVLPEKSAWTNIGTAFQFDTGGKLVSPVGTATTIPNLTINNVAIGNVTLNYGAGGLVANSPSQATTSNLTQNGYTSGTLKDVSVSETGEIIGNYTNGNSLAIARIKVVQFTNPDGLAADSSGNYKQTADSGPPRVGLGSTQIIGGNVELSNTDIAGEFSKMIVTQQAYSANTKVISTAQDMMSSLINIIR